MKMPRIHLSLLMTILSLSCLGQFRKYSNEFLNIGAGARGLAMGSAQIASVSDGTAGYWNPAALVGVKDHPNLNRCIRNISRASGSMTMRVLPFPWRITREP